MQVQATAIFLYDLYLLGYYEINLTEFFCSSLCNYVRSTANLYPDAVKALFDITNHNGQLHMRISANVFRTAFALAQRASIDSSSVSPLFEGLDQNVINQIGDFTSGFSIYLIDMMEMLGSDATLGDYRYIKQ
ncbi:MAG: hypothetical protein IJO63_00640 [Bacilli bacterium]|nr:hypothetical protein [Bacilli bacterium]